MQLSVQSAAPARSSLRAHRFTSGTHFSFGQRGHAMGGPRSCYLLASMILAIGVGMAFMDDSDTVDRASRHTAKPSVQAAPPSTQGVPASRDRATIGDPEPERRTEVAGLTTGRSEADGIAGVAAEAPPQAALKAQAIPAEPPASAGAAKEAKPATKPAVH